MKPTTVSRINAFDLLRGWCLVVIISDHLMRFPSLFDALTGRGLLWVTAAEGFFFISGALVGIVRGRKMKTGGLMAAAKASWDRAGKLFIASIILTFVFTALALWLGPLGFDNLKGGVATSGSVWEIIWKTVTLQYSYGWTDFLNYYVVLLLLSPLALWMLSRGWWWALAAFSLVLWVGKLAIHDITLLSHLTWQLYFFGGIIFGYHYGHIHAYYRSLAESTRRRIWTLMLSATGLTLLASFAFTFGTPVFEGVNATLYEFFRYVKDQDVFTMLFQENRTGLLRPLVFALWFGSLFWLVRRYESKIIEKVGGLFLPLGKNSLYVYIMQGVVVFLVTLIVWPDNLWLNTLINVASIALIWLMVKKRFLFAVVPR